MRMREIKDRHKAQRMDGEATRGDPRPWVTSARWVV